MHEETAAAGMQAATKLAGLGGRPMGVVCGNDLLALGVLLGLQKAELRVPEDFALVGYDDVEFAAALSPPLTSVRQPSYQMGMAAARLLFEAPTGGGQHIRFEPELIPRASSGLGSPGSSLRGSSPPAGSSSSTRTPTIPSTPFVAAAR